MELFITGLHIVLCFFLILVVLLQPGKGADFGAAMGGASQEVLGAAGSVSLLAKLTTVVAGMFMATSLSLAWFSNAPEGSVIDVEGIEQELLEARKEAGGSAGATDSEAATTDTPSTDAATLPPATEAAPAEGADAAPDEGAEAAPDEGAEAAPDEGAEAAPDEGAEAAPGEGTEAAPDEEAAPDSE